MKRHVSTKFEKRVWRDAWLDDPEAASHFTPSKIRLPPAAGCSDYQHR
jgi:hypothetical protein